MHGIWGGLTGGRARERLPPGTQTGRRVTAEVGPRQAQPVGEVVREGAVGALTANNTPGVEPSSWWETGPMEPSIIPRSRR